jgi:dUTP pyrophosphatase
LPAGPNLMKIKIKRFDKTLPMPKYQTAKAAGFDLYLRHDEKILSKENKLLACNLAVKIPKGYFLFITPRSSTIGTYGLLVVSGVIDGDYCGENDEIKISVFNLSGKTVVLERGTRIAQGILVKISQADLVEVPKMSSPSRGGFGTTGFK